MLTRERTDSTRTARGTFMTSIAMGPSRAIDVDEWLYRASRVRAFASEAVDYVPKHRADATA